MPSFPYSAGRLRLTGAEMTMEPVRFSYTPGRLGFTGASMTMGVNLTVTDGTRLPRLQSRTSYYNPDGTPTAQQQLFWQQFADRIERRFTDIESVLAAIQAAQQTASTALQQAQTTAREKALEDSYCDPLKPVSAASDGTITVANHARVYGDGARVNVTGGTVTGFVSGDEVTVYYNDPSRAGGAVTYLGTKDVIGQTGDTHIVGQVTIPAAGSPPATGDSPTPPGYSKTFGADV